MRMKQSFSEITPYLADLAALSCAGNHINAEMYQQHHIFRGLRDMNGNGVATGLTEISRIKAREKDASGNDIPCEGELFYRGVNIRDIVNGFMNENRFGFGLGLRKRFIFYCFPHCQQQTS